MTDAAALHHARPSEGSAGAKALSRALPLLSHAELRQLHSLSPARFALRTAVEWSLILGAMWLWASFGSLLAWLVAFLVIGTRQHALINSIHETTHYGASRKRNWNDLVSDLFFAGPCLLATASFREGHLPHHRWLGDPERDTEVREWTQVSCGGFLRLLLRHFSGLAAVSAVLRYDPRTPTGTGPSKARYLGFVALTNAALFAFCWQLGAPLAWLHLWLYPLFSLALLLVTVVALVQHQTEEYARLGALRRDFAFDPPLTRDTHATSPIERFFVAPIGAAYHLEHHLFPAVPYSRLGRLNRLLCARGFYAQPVEGAGSGYLAALARLIRAGRPREVTTRAGIVRGRT